MKPNFELGRTVIKRKYNPETHLVCISIGPVVEIIDDYTCVIDAAGTAETVTTKGDYYHFLLEERDDCTPSVSYQAVPYRIGDYVVSQGKYEYIIGPVVMIHGDGRAWIQPSPYSSYTLYPDVAQDFIVINDRPLVCGRFDGVFQINSTDTCEVCNGSGRLDSSYMVAGEWTKDSEMCEWCGGTGREIITEMMLDEAWGVYHRLMLTPVRTPEEATALTKLRYDAASYALDVQTAYGMKASY